MAETGTTSPRERYRTQVRTEIKRHAWGQIATAGASALSLNAIAKQMGLSGPALYRYFANRDELVLAVVLRELDRSHDHSLNDFIGGVTTPADAATAMVESAAYLLETIRGNPKLQIFLNREGAATVAGASEALFTAIAEQLRPYLEPLQQRGIIRAELDLSEASEWILRSILSLLTVDGPVPRSPDDERHFLATFLAPALIADAPTPLPRTAGAAAS